LSNEQSSSSTKAATAPAGADSPAPTIRWDDSKMQSRYANAVQVKATRDEIVLLLGTHQEWQNPDAKDVKEVVVPLEERILLSPATAKRLFAQLTLILAGYEGRFGKISLDGGKPPAPAPAQQAK